MVTRACSPVRSAIRHGVVTLTRLPVGSSVCAGRNRLSKSVHSFPAGFVVVPSRLTWQKSQSQFAWRSCGGRGPGPELSDKEQHRDIHCGTRCYLRRSGGPRAGCEARWPSGALSQRRSLVAPRVAKRGCSLCGRSWDAHPIPGTRCRSHLRAKDATTGDRDHGASVRKHAAAESSHSGRDAGYCAARDRQRPTGNGALGADELGGGRREDSRYSVCGRAFRLRSRFLGVTCALQSIAPRVE